MLPGKYVSVGYDMNSGRICTARFSQFDPPFKDSHFTDDFLFWISDNVGFHTFNITNFIHNPLMTCCIITDRVYFKDKEKAMIFKLAWGRS